MGQYERNSHAVPLVYGVCRTASAPTLSHGGSRLNASKPEANPKTRYPTPNKTHCKILPHGSIFSLKKPVFRWEVTQYNRIVNQYFKIKLFFHVLIESPHKPLLHLVAQVAQSKSNNHKRNNQQKRFEILRYTSLLYLFIPNQRKQHTKHFVHQVPLQTIGHAWAGISGMLQLRLELKRHLRREALNLEA